MGLTTLLDTSAWVEYLRATGSEVNMAVRSLVGSQGRAIAITDVVIMELLAGVRVAEQREKLWALMNRCLMLPTRPLFDYEVAAELFARCRQAGFTPANTNDLLVAAVAIGKRVPLLAADTDFEKIASVSSLSLASA
ncbi:MAG TPA: PIN domain-containing protein [Acidimicrobiia bacterium]|nr:PIN domain-containing protein [Acidimicrobiia bacterium]